MDLETSLSKVASMVYLCVQLKIFKIITKIYFCTSKRWNKKRQDNYRIMNFITQYSLYDCRLTDLDEIFPDFSFSFFFVNSRVSVSHLDVNTWNLHIKSVTEEDRGGYMCQINTDPMKSQVRCFNHNFAFLK